jgi:Glycosyltransferase
MTPEVIVNGRFLSRRVTGVERYGREILSCIGEGYRLERTRLNGLRGQAWEQCILPQKINSNSILWSPANTGPLAIRNQALTIHDLSPLEHPEWFRPDFAVWYRSFLPILVRRVRMVFTPSETVKRKVCKRFGVHNVIVTPNAVDPHAFFPGAQQTSYNLPPRYVLFLGTLEPRKNLRGLLQAWNDVKEDFRDVWLIVAGTYGKVFKPMRIATEMERVRFLGYVEEADLAGLYAGASLFVLPSLDEGFGLPVLEAMACGAPVIVSNCEGLCEVVQDAGVIFDLTERQGLSRAMRECLANQSLRSSMKEKGVERSRSFSWQMTATLIWKTLNAI